MNRMGQRRTDWDEHRAQMRAAGRARRAAVDDLIANHAAEYARRYREACAAEDPPVEPVGVVQYDEQAEALEIEAEIARLKALLALQMSQENGKVR